MEESAGNRTLGAAPERAIFLPMKRAILTAFVAGAVALNAPPGDAGEPTIAPGKVIEVTRMQMVLEPTSRGRRAPSASFVDFGQDALFSRRDAINRGGGRAVQRYYVGERAQTRALLDDTWVLRPR